MQITITGKTKPLVSIDTYCGTENISKGIDVSFLVGNLKGTITFRDTDFNTPEDIIKLGVENELKSIALMLATEAH